MALSVQGSSTQVALLDQHSLGKELITAVARSGKELAVAGQKTVATFNGFKEAMEARCVALEQTNRTLTQRIAALEGEQREKASVLDKQLANGLQREQAARQEAEALRKEKCEAEQKLTEQKAAAFAAQAKAQLAESEKQASEARALAAERDAAVSRQEIAAVRAEAVQKEAAAAAEKNAAVAAATETGQAQVASEGQKTAEALQQKAEGAQKIAALELWRKDTETMVVQFGEIGHEWQFRCVDTIDGPGGANFMINGSRTLFIDSFNKFIKRRLGESLELITDPALQRSITKEMQQLILSIPSPDPSWRIQTPEIDVAKAKLLELCKARIARGL